MLNSLSIKEYDIWVTGAKGQLGLALQELWKDSDLSIIYTDTNVDITNANKIEHFTRSKSFNYVINCAGMSDIITCENQVSSAYKVNCSGPENLARFCRQDNSTLIQLSCDQVFDDSQTAFAEEDHTAPLNVFGKTKVLAETTVPTIAKKFYILRTSCLYGPKRPNYIFDLLDQFKKHIRVPAYVDKYRNFTATREVAEVIDAIVNQPYLEYGIYHYCNSTHISYFEFAEEVKNIWSLLTSKTVDIIPIKSYGSEYHNSTPDRCPLTLTKIEKELKLKSYSWKELLKETLHKILEIPYEKIS